jgi:transcriptional regulator with XRE-family HTH domain
METFSGIGKRIRIKREEKDMTQQELADICGVSLSYIGYLERGKRKAPNLTLLSKISQTLNTSLDYLVNGDSNSYVKNALSDIEKHIAELSEDDVKQIVTIVKTFKGFE